MSYCAVCRVCVNILMLFAVSWNVVFRVQQLTAPHGGLAATNDRGMSDTIGVCWALQLKHKTVDTSPPCHVDQSCSAGKIWTSEGNGFVRNTFPCYRQLRESGLCHSSLKTAAPWCVCDRESSCVNGQIWSWQTHVMREIKVVPNALCSCK